MATIDQEPVVIEKVLEPESIEEEQYSTAEEDELSIGSSEDIEEDDTIGERQQGDGEESIPDKPLDDDEDKKNPQYIPKRGGFYEHDDRLMPGEEPEEPPKPKEVAPQRKTSKVMADRWLHDHYDERQQGPKTEAELIAIYGFDIRKGEGAPRARRRRRYGGGPKQYTRSWEDEEAYRRDSVVSQRDASRKSSRKERHPDFEGGPRAEEFPPLGAKEERSAGHGLEPRQNDVNQKLSSIENQQRSDEPSDRNQEVRRKSSDKTDHQRRDGQPPSRGGRPLRGRSSKGDIEFPPGAEEEGLLKGVESLHLSEHGYQKVELPPRLQEAAGRPKRYSTQRQQTGSPAPNLVSVMPQQSPPMVLGGALGNAFGPGVRVPGPAFYDQAAFQQPPQPSALPNFVPPFPSTPTFVQFARAPPPVPIYPTPEGLTAFVAPGTGSPAQQLSFPGVQQDQMPYQQGLYNAQQPLSPAQELYQGGVTYYAPHGQVPVTQFVQKRPNAAIPIVAPPEPETSPTEEAEAEYRQEQDVGGKIVEEPTIAEAVAEVKDEPPVQSEQDREINEQE